MTYLARFKANLAAGSAFSDTKVTKMKDVEVKTGSGSSTERKKVIDATKLLTAVFLSPNTAQGVVAMVIMAPLAVLVVLPLLLLGSWALDKEEKNGNSKESHKRPIMAGLAVVIIVLIAALVLLAFLAIRLVVTPFTEFANLVRSAYKAATSKDGDIVRPPRYDAEQIFSKIPDVAKHVWTLGLLLLVPAIKRLVTLDGQIAALKAKEAAKAAKEAAKAAKPSNQPEAALVTSAPSLLMSGENIDATTSKQKETTEDIGLLKGPDGKFSLK